MPEPTIIAFVPVLHQGYLRLFDAYPDAKKIYLIDPATIKNDSLDYLHKDIRILPTTIAQAMITGLNRFTTVEIFNNSVLSKLDTADSHIVLPDEDISHAFGDQFMHASITYHSVFLRWDRRSIENIDAEAKNVAETADRKDVEYMHKAMAAAGHSTDIWRRVGAAVVLDNGTVTTASNSGEPNPLSPWMEGDPRNIFNRGVGIEMSVFSHAEAILIARAAYHGVSLKNARMYVTDFPCPACAKLIAHSGISHLYYKNGYAVLDGETVLNEYAVNLAKIIVEEQDDHSEVWVPYTKK